MPTLRLGTRASLLAQKQAALIAREIESRCNVSIDTILITTTGDKILDRPLYESGGKGLFVKELEQALLDSRIDFAVHSLKDVPVTMPLTDQTDLLIAAIPARADPRDVLISGVADSIESLPKGAIIATGSLRRKCQLLDLRPDLRIEPIRGNIDTRIRKIKSGEFAATILALAGLERAGLFDGSMMHPLPLEKMLPAPGQAALALQCRKADKATREILECLDHPPSRAAVEAERAVVAALNCDCHSPIAVLAHPGAQRLDIRAALGGFEGTVPVRRALGGTVEEVVRQMRGTDFDLTKHE